MIYNDEQIEIEKVDAFYIIDNNSSNKYIEIFSKDGKHILFGFNNSEFHPKKMEKNKKIDLKKYIYWDVELVTGETNYIFDITKDTINLTRLDENLFNIKVNIENPDMIKNTSFKNLIIDSNFSFVYDRK